MAVKLIVTDLDGTLMAPDHQTVTQRTRAALKAAHDKGVKVAIATGRTLTFTDNVTSQIPFADYVIYSNGAAVFDRNAKKDVYKNCISARHTEELLNIFDAFPIYYNIYVNGKIYVQNDKTGYYINRGLPQAFLDEFTRLSATADKLSEKLRGECAEIIALYNVSDEHKKTLVSEFEKRNLYITSSLPDEIEITAPNVNKGTALDGFCKDIGVTADEVMAFGDAMNDYEMLKLAKYSFAMGNAVDEIKEIVNYQAATNADDGLARAVEEYVL